MFMAEKPKILMSPFAYNNRKKIFIHGTYYNKGGYIICSIGIKA